jgi:hypothetical protein
MIQRVPFEQWIPAPRDRVFRSNPENLPRLMPPLPLRTTSVARIVETGRSCATIASTTWGSGRSAPQ